MIKSETGSVSIRTRCFLLYRKLRISYKVKNAPRDAHSRDWKMSHATAHGARVRKADSLFWGVGEEKGDGLILGGGRRAFLRSAMIRFAARDVMVQKLSCFEKVP